MTSVNQIVAPYYNYDLVQGATTDGTYDLMAGRDNSTIMGGLGGTTIYANADTSSSRTYYNTTVYGNAGTNTIIAEALGVDKIYGGTGNDTVRDYGTLAAGTVLDGGAGSNTLELIQGQSDISAATIANFQTLSLNTFITRMTADQFNSFTTINVSNAFGPGEIDAASAGTYSLRAHTFNGAANLNASTTTADVTLIGDDHAGQVLTGGAGKDTLIGGNGANDVLVSGSGNTTFVVGTGNNSIYGNGGYNDYQFGAVFGQDTINNANTPASTARGDINFTASSITKQKLWLKQTGNDLVIRLLGTSQTVTATGWFAGTYANAQTLGIKLSDGLELTPARVATLVTAMAAYQTGHSSFNPATATSMPTDTTLQNAITSAWNKYDSIVTNPDGSWIGTLNDHVGSNWTSIADHYTSTSQLEESYQNFDDGGYAHTIFNLDGGDWIKGVYFHDASDDLTAVNVYNTDGSHSVTTYNLSGGTLDNTQNWYAPSGDMSYSKLNYTDGSSVGTSYDLEGGDWTTGVYYRNANDQLTQKVVTYFADDSYDRTTYNLSGGPLANTVDYYFADGTLANKTENFTDGSVISTDYDVDGGDWIKGVYTYNPSGQLLQEDVFYSGGSHWITAGTLTTTMNGGTGYNGYELNAATFGQDVIHNGGGSAAHGEIDFDASSITKQKLWFKHVGNDLVINRLGSTNQVDIVDWYSSAGNQVQSIHTADGLKLDTQIAQLVTAMASYQTAHSSFNSTTASTMPTDTALQNAITASWHS